MLTLRADPKVLKLFDGGVELAAGKAPDMSHLDARVCPFMEREVEKAGAQTAKEIRAAVKAAWKKITPAMCRAIAARVRGNMLKVILSLIHI